MSKPTFCIREKTKAQISFAVTVKLISTFVFATWIVQFPYFIIPNFKPLAIFCACTVGCVSDLFRNHIVVFLMMPLKCCLLSCFQTHVQHIREELAKFPEEDRDDVVILFSAHSLPLRVRLYYTVFVPSSIRGSLWKFCIYPFKSLCI